MPITRRFTDRNVYTVQMRMGSPTPQSVDLVLATNTEWTMVTSINCTAEVGCDHGVYDASKTESEIISDDNLMMKTVNVSHL